MKDAKKEVHTWSDKDKKHLFEIMLWYSCNANCLFCSNEMFLRQMDKAAIPGRTQAVLRQILAAKKDGYKILGLTGGEPTIYPDILKILSFAKQLDFRTIRVQTNALRLADKNFCRQIIDAGATYIKFSIHGHKAELHDKLVQVPGAFDLTMKAFDNLAELEVATETNFLINRANYKFLPQFIAAMFNRNKGRFVIIFPMYEGKMKQAAKTLGIKLSQAAPYILEAMRLAKDLNLDKVVTLNVPMCFLPGFERHATERRPFNVKVSTPTGESESVDRNMREYKVKSPKCRLCRHNRRCLGLWRSYVEIYGLDEIKPVR